MMGGDVSNSDVPVSILQSKGSREASGAVSFTAEDKKQSHHRAGPSSNTSPVIAKEPEETSTIDLHMPGEFVTTDAEKSYELSESVGAVGGKDVFSTALQLKEFFQNCDDEKLHILVGVTGSVATIKIPLLIDKLLDIYTPEKVSIQLIVTSPAEHFLRGLKISPHVQVWKDSDIWFDLRRTGDVILHHELRRWADIFLVAPLSANTLAKWANGLSDNLLTAALRDWSPSIPIILAPAMNTFMYNNPMTKKHLRSLEEDAPYITILKPVEKVLICGDIGMGGMREWVDIVEVLRRRLNEMQDQKVVVEEDEDEVSKEELDEEVSRDVIDSEDSCASEDDDEHQSG